MSREAAQASSRTRSMEVVTCPWSEKRGDSGHSQVLLLGLLTGEGIFSKIYRCESVTTRKQYLLKKVQLEGLAKTDLESRLKEVDIWKKLRHPNILRCHNGWQTSDSELWILSETANQSVEQLVLSKGCAPPQALFEKWLYQLALALKYLHEDRDTCVLHRNIKPSNIMVVDHYILKLTDFGFSRKLSSTEDMANSQVGSGRIMSPEMLKKQPYDCKTDIWSLGITAVFIATLQEAVHARTFETLIRKTKAGQVRGIGGRYNRKIEDIINSLLQVEPSHRPSASELAKRLKSDFINCSRSTSVDSYPERKMVSQLSSSTAGVGDGIDAADALGDVDSDRLASCQPGGPEQELSLLSLTDDNCNTSDILVPAENRRVSSSNQKRHPTSKTTLSDGPNAIKPTSSRKKKAVRTETLGPELPVSTSSSATQIPSTVVQEISQSQTDGRGRRSSSRQMLSTRPDVLSMTIISILIDERGSNSSTSTSSRSDSRRASAEDQTTRNIRVIRRSTERPISASSRTPQRKSASRAATETPVRGNLDHASSRELQRYNNTNEAANGITKSQRDTKSCKSDLKRRQSEGRLSTTATSSREAPDNTRSSKHAPTGRNSRTMSLGSPDENWPTMTPDCGKHQTKTEYDDTTTSDEKGEDPLINTFPGAFNVQKNSPRLPFQSRHPETVPPDLSREPEATQEKAMAAAAHCSQSDARDLHASAAAATAQVPGARWPTNLRQYWTIASDLVSKLGADVLLLAVNIARLFSREEVEMWLHQNVGETGSTCIEGILTLVELSNQLDDETLQSVHDSFLQRNDDRDAFD